MKCELREWELEYAKDLVDIINNKKVQDNLRDGIPYPYQESDAEFFIQEMMASDKNENFAFAIFADGVLCGSISVLRQGNVHSRTGELGYYIGEPFWGRGIVSDAVGQLCRYVFANSDILRIFGEPYSYNTASCRILEKNGFTHEGTLRSNAVKNGRVLDMEMYGLVKGDCLE